MKGNKIRFYYRKILGFLYLILSLVWIYYKGISSLGLGDIFIAVSLIIIGISIGFIYDLIKDLSIASFLTYQLPIAIAYFLPITILLTIGAYKFQKI